MTLVTEPQHTADVQPHAAVMAAMSCSEDRLRGYYHQENVTAGEGFTISLAGGGALLLGRLDGEFALRQWIYLFGVDPFDEGVIRLHLHCGMIAGLAKDSREIFSLYDPTDVGDLYRLGDMGADLVREAIYRTYGADITIRVEVHDIIHGPDGRPTGLLMPRP